MVKVRLMGTSNEVDVMVAFLLANRKVLSVSDKYLCRGSDYVRVYVEVAA